MNDRLTDLLRKYDVPVPRYTSYPAVPHWQDVAGPRGWFRALEDALAPESASLAVYVHLPFCETLCTFCGCNTVITRHHERSSPYVDLVLRELDLYLANVPALAATAGFATALRRRHADLPVVAMNCEPSCRACRRECRRGPTATKDRWKSIRG